MNLFTAEFHFKMTDVLHCGSNKNMSMAQNYLISLIPTMRSICLHNKNNSTSNRTINNVFAFCMSSNEKFIRIEFDTISKSIFTRSNGIDDCGAVFGEFILVTGCSVDSEVKNLSLSKMKKMATFKSPFSIIN